MARSQSRARRRAPARGRTQGTQRTSAPRSSPPTRNLPSPLPDEREEVHRDVNHHHETAFMEDVNEENSDSHLLLTEYEKQRNKRIAENASRLAALNIPSIRAPSHPNQEPAAKKNQSDDEYIPGRSGSDQSSESHDEQEGNTNIQNDDNVAVEENRALQQALALSLEVLESDVATKKVLNSRKRSGSKPNNNGKPKKIRRKGQREQFSDDDIAAIFSVFDDNGKGKFSLEELERIAKAHEFVWSKEEVQDMINIFDQDKDGELDLEEFRSIFKRAGMMKQKSAT